MAALDNFIRVLRCIAGTPADRSLTEVARQVGLAKSHVHKMLGKLVEEGLAQKDTRTGRYRAGLTLFELGANAVAGLQLDVTISPYLSFLARRTEETVTVGVLHGSDVVYIRNIDSQHALRAAQALGSRVPAHTVGSGKALLAHQPEAALAAMLDRGLPAFTRYTITDPDRFRQELAAVHQQGYAVGDQEAELGVRGVAAPIFHGTEAVAAIAVCAPVQRFPHDKIPVLGSLVRSVSARVSGELSSPRAGGAQGRLPEMPFNAVPLTEQAAWPPLD